MAEGRQAASPRQYRLILLFVDGSDAAMDTAAHAAMLARTTGAAVAILAVIDTSAGFSFSTEGMTTYQRLRAETQAVIEAASTAIRAAGVTRIEHLIMDGTPGEAILDVADEQGADLIVLGGGRAMLGDAASVAVHVVRTARCPVLIVPAERKPR